ncbi:MAG: quinolinate synthase NadA [Planctomycetes bacterium]|nr:quinolinate synthase NadA [Planctomycetota bacterium]
MQEYILELKKKRNAIILAHNYQRGEVQDIADVIGDSLLLAQKAAKTDCEIIVFCGVHFMAETAAIFSPEKIVLIPDKEAGCSLASMISVDSLCKWKSEHPGAIVVCYVNSSAEVKAESDYCCTSSNAHKVINAIPEDREILFIPDQYLGQYLKNLTGRNIHIWPGYCHAHHKITTESVVRKINEHPEAEFVMHPECGCLTHCMKFADKILSTEGIVKYVKESPNKSFIIGTEVGILDRIKRVAPEKEVHPVTEEAYCEFMKLNTLEKIAWSLEDLEYRVTVPEDIAKKARVPIQRMLEIV